MQSGSDRPRLEPADSLASAAASVRTLESLAALLRDLRRRHARIRRDSTLTYRELAAKTGWSQTAIAEYFTARTLPPTDRFDALLELLGTTPAERQALATARDRVEEANRRARNGRFARTGPATLPRPVVPAPVSAEDEDLAAGLAAGLGSGHGPVPALPSHSSASVHTGSLPRQLPVAPRLFTGRARELTALDRALDAQARSNAAMVCVVGGMGGIGKTWLALHWAYRRLDRFPDGQLYADLCGFDPSGRPVAAVTVLRAFLEALGVPLARIPVEPEARAGLYRSLVAERRMLVVLDNARDTAQVLPLLPGGAACAALITSRRQLAGLMATHAARSVALDCLPDKEARHLLARHLGRGRLDAEPGPASVLLSHCAGLPLALSIVAARANGHPGVALATLAAELTGATGATGADVDNAAQCPDLSQPLDALDAGEPQADLRAVLSWSSRALCADAAHAFSLLGIAPGPDIALPAAASLLALPAASTRTLLRELQQAHLIQEHRPGRYRMHDLLRLHATELAEDRLTPVERQVAQRRVIDFYTHTACAGARLLALHHPPPPLGDPAPGCEPQPLPDAASTMAFFDAEHANLLAAQQSAYRRGWDAGVCHLAWALDPYHRRRGHLHELVAAWELAVEHCERLCDPAMSTQARQMLGDAYAQHGRSEDARRQLQLALALAERTGDIAAQGEIHHSLGGTWERHGDDHRALEHAHRALLIFSTLGDTFRQARALNGVGWLQTRLGDYAGARANCRAALTLLRERCADGRGLGESNTLDSLGYIAQRTGEYGEALDYYHQALIICRAEGHSYLEADILDHLAETHAARQQPDAARELWREARELYFAQRRHTDAERVRQELIRLDQRSR